MNGLVQVKSRGGQLRKEHLIPLILDFCRSAQDVLSSTASNYDVRMLGTGIACSGLATLLALCSLGVPTRWRVTAEGIWFVAVVLAYGILMFASSYVEEEQWFWYWITGGWLVFLYLRA
jgi:ethanolamine phosphate transferase 2 subunit G